MLQQLEVTELLSDLNRKQAERSFFYAVLAGLTALIILMFGLTMLYSTTFASSGERYFYAQLEWAVLGILAMGSVIFIGYRRLGNWSIYMLIVLIIALALAAFLAEKINGANRWLPIPVLNMNAQPSEFAKVLLPLFGAKAVSDHLRNLGDWKQWKVFWLPALLIAVTLALVLAGHDLGATMLLGAGMVVLIVIGGVQKRFLVIPLLVLVLIFFMVKAFSPERMSRITSFMNPESVEMRDNDGYQLWNSLLALGSGGWQGIGFMESRMKQLYLPESHTDFILAITGEELGYLGLLAVIAGYLIFGWCGMKIAMNSRSRYGMLLAAVFTAIIEMQAIINIGVVAGALPTKGLSAPLISYGGSSLLSTLIMVGLLVSIGLENVPGLTDNWWGRKK